MAIDIIPPGASVVVSDNQHNKKDYWVELMEAVKDAQADGVRTTKDSEANIERSLSVSFQNAIQDTKDAEARLHKDAGDKFIQIVQDVKDAEARLDRSSGDRFIQTIQDIKDAAKDVALAGAKGVETTKDVEYQLEKSNGHTRERMESGFRHTENEMFKQFEYAQKTAYENQMRNLGQFKDQALLSEKLAAHQELLSERLAAHQALLSERLAAEAAAKAAECCCELKEAVRADGDRTRALINSITEQNLRDRAAKAEAGLAAYFAAKVAPTTPVV